MHIVCVCVLVCLGVLVWAALVVALLFSGKVTETFFVPNGSFSIVPG